jgi:transcriptional regulator with XRE-family HTH domain
MKINITKEWFASRADLEKGLEIGAGALQHVGNPGLRIVSVQESLSNVGQHLTFGRFVELMRRKQGWTIPQLAQAAESTVQELLVIEHDPHHVPELSTVYGLANSFKVEPMPLLKIAGLAETRSSRLQEESLQFAALSESKAPLNPDEEIALQAFLKVIIEESDNK